MNLLLLSIIIFAVIFYIIIFINPNLMQNENNSFLTYQTLAIFIAIVIYGICTFYNKLNKSY